MLSSAAVSASASPDPDPALASQFPRYTPGSNWQHGEKNIWENGKKEIENLQKYFNPNKNISGGAQCSREHISDALRGLAPCTPRDKVRTQCYELLHLLQLPSSIYPPPVYRGPVIISIKIPIKCYVEILITDCTHCSALRLENTTGGAGARAEH